MASKFDLVRARSIVPSLYLHVNGQAQYLTCQKTYVIANDQLPDSCNQSNLKQTTAIVSYGYSQLQKSMLLNSHKTCRAARLLSTFPSDQATKPEVPRQHKTHNSNYIRCEFFSRNYRILKKCGSRKSRAAAQEVTCCGIFTEQILTFLPLVSFQSTKWFRSRVTPATNLY